MGVESLGIGARIRRARLRAGRDQAVIAGLVGITPDYLGQIERGQKIPTVAVLHAVAAEPGTPLAALPDGEPPDPTPAPREPAADVATALTEGFAHTGPSDTLPRLRDRVNVAWHVRQSSPTRFTEAAELVPGLVRGVEAAVRNRRRGADVAARREACRVAADLYFLVRSYCRRTGRVDLSLLAADRALRAAEDADDPLRIAAARWNLCHVLLASRQPDRAEQVALRAADDIAPYLDGDADMAALHGALHLVAAIGSARRRDWWTARRHLAGAATADARRCGERNVLWTAFGPTNVLLHRVSVEMEAGEATEALRIAGHVGAAVSPFLERRFTHLLELACCHDLHRDDAAALLVLLEPERLAPEDLANAPLTREILRNVTRRARGRHATLAGELSVRLETR